MQRQIRMLTCYWCAAAQLEQRRAQLTEVTLAERAAKAVLEAATAAARQGRTLDDAARRDAERSVRAPDEWAAEQEATRSQRAKARRPCMPSLCRCSKQPRGRQACALAARAQAWCQ